MKCKDVIKIATSEQELGFFKSVEFRLHLMMCKNCRDYIKTMVNMCDYFCRQMQKVFAVDPEKVKKLEDEVIAKAISKRGNGENGT